MTDNGGQRESLQRRPSSLLSPVRDGPEWVLSLKFLNASQRRSNQRQNGSRSCSVCEVALGNQMEKRTCKCCGKVTCRVCTALVHLVDHRRRKYVCFRCLKDATAMIPDRKTKESSAMALTVVAEGDGDAGGKNNKGNNGRSRKGSSRRSTSNNRSVNLVAGVSPGEESEKGFLDSVWGMWSRWMDQDGTEVDAQEEAELSGDDSEGPASDGGGAEEALNTVPSAAARHKGKKMMDDVDEGSAKFDGYEMSSLLKASLNADTRAINANLFLEACAQVVCFTSALGKGFGFANVDLNHKIEIVNRRIEEYAKAHKVAAGDVSLQQLVDYDVKRKVTHAGKKAAPASRTILRLLWFIDFNRHLLRTLAEDTNAELKPVCAMVYETTLAPHHAFYLRRIVKMGMGMVPSRRMFRERASLTGMSPAKESETLMAWAEPGDEVSTELWAFMTSKGLQKLP